MSLLATLEQAGMKSYTAKELYKHIKDIDTIDVDATNRVVDNGGDTKSLRIVSDGKCVYVPLRKDVPVTKPSYKIGEFSAPEDFEYDGKTISAGTIKYFAY